MVGPTCQQSGHFGSCFERRSESRLECGSRLVTSRQRVGTLRLDAKQPYTADTCAVGPTLAGIRNPARGRHASQADRLL